MSLYSSNLIILFPVGCCLYIAMRLADVRTDSPSASGTRALLYTIVSLMICISLVGLLLRIGPLNLLWLGGFAVASGIILARTQVVGRAAMLLSFISLKSGSQPLRMAGDFVRLNSGVVSRRARKLQRELALGKNWPTALETTRIARTNHEILWCRLVAKYGPTVSQELPPTLHPLRIQREIEQLMARLTVLPWLLQGLPVVIFILAFLLPSIQDMVMEFGLSSSRTITLIRLLSLSIEFPFNVLLLIVSLLGLFLSGIIVLLVAVPQLIHAFPFYYFFSSYHRAVSLMGLAAAGKREPGLMEACRVAAQMVPSVHFSKRLQMAADRISEGTTPQLALVQSGVLGRKEAAFVTNAINSRSLSWALQQIAITQTERTLRKLSAFIQLAVIFIVLTFSALYGLIAYTVMDFISQMIQQVAR